MMLCSHCSQSARPDVLHLEASSIAWPEPVEITQDFRYLQLLVHGNNLNLPNKDDDALPTHGSAGLLQHLCSVTQELQQSRQPQLLNPLAWSPALQGLGAASLMLVAALLWSSLRRTSLSSQHQHAAV